MVLCKRCGRLLKSESSIELGYGLTCAKKAGVIISKIKKQTFINKDKCISLEEF